MALAEGSALPDFSLPDQTGATVTLADLKGKPFVLYFYPKDDTSGCTSEAIAFSGLTSDFDALGVPVIGISPDPVKKHVKFVEKHDLKVRLLSDEEKIFLEACGVWVEKSMYGRKYMGIERVTYLIGSDGKVAQRWDKVKVPGHGAEVLEAVSELDR